MLLGRGASLCIQRGRLRQTHLVRGMLFKRHYLVFTGSDDMNEDTLKGQWMQWKGLIREHWGKLTNDDIDQIEGRSEQLIGKLQERYGIARDEAERQLNAWDPMTRPVR
jgi:uncharacterized protein YjbJ (UPF0337 family)